MNRAVTDPARLLDQFSQYLTDVGGVMSGSEKDLIELMLSANRKLVPKCISLCIISSSTSESQLQLCKEGAWDILLKWLQEALKEDNYTFLMELLKVYLQLPVRLEQLTQNVCPKLINSLTKRCEHEEIKSIAVEIVKKWKDVISADSRRSDQSHAKKKKLESDLKPPSKEPTLIESLKDEKKRRSTVKITPTNLRTAGIEENTLNSIPKSRSDVLTKKSKSESEVRIPPEIPLESFHQKISVTPTESRKVISELHESSDFINALTTAPSSVVRKKRKLSTKLEPISQIDTKEDISMDTSETSCTEETSPSPSPKGMGTKKSSLTSIYSAFAVDSKPKKRVSWAEEDKLQTFFYFELDESERVNVNRVSVEDNRRKEHSMERQFFQRSHSDFEVGFQKWYSPCPLERLYLVEPGCKSVERQIQAERECSVLQAIYFTRESIPVSPEEPEMETVEFVSPVVIPLDDLTIYDSKDCNLQNNTDNLLVVKDTQGNTQMSLNPEVANFVKSLAANLTSSPNETSSHLNTSNMYSGSPTAEPFEPASQESSVPTPDIEYDKTLTSLNIPKNRVDSDCPDQMLQKELWEVLEQNYPDINVHNLSAERIRDLLEPLREQLVSRGIFHLRHSESNDSSVTPYQGPPPGMNTPHRMRPPYHPPLMPPRPGFRPPPPNPGPRMGPPMNNPYRPMNQHPHFSPPIPVQQFGPGHTMKPSNGPPPNRGPPFMRNTNRNRAGQICKFYQQGGCRNGPSCNFLHSQR